MSAVKDMALLPKDDLAVPVAPSINVAAMFEKLAANPGIDVAKLQALIDMQERLLANQAKAEFDASFAQMQSELPVVAARARGDKWKYAPREDIIAAVRPVLAKHGFSLAHRTEWPTPATVKVVGILTHRLGHERNSEFQTPADKTGSKNDVQALGSATEYGRRYTTLDLLGIATGDDDNAASVPTKPVASAPAGYDDWLLDLANVAEEGTDRLHAAWTKSKAAYRTHLTGTTPQKWEQIKRQAAQASKDGAQ